jgi:hypothetical protein
MPRRQLHGGHAVALFAGPANASEKTGILEIACCEMRNLARRQDTRVPGIDADDHRAGATDRFARLIRPLWTGDDAHRAQVTSATPRRERRLKQDGLRLQQLGDFAVSQRTS